MRINKGSKSIRRKFNQLMILLSIFLIMISLTGILFLRNTQEQVINDYERSANEYDAINNVARSLEVMLFRARGYYAFQSEVELALLFEELEAFNRHITHLETLDLDQEQLALKQDLDDFYTTYSEELLPLAISFVENDDYQALRELSGGGANEEINQFLAYTNNYNNEVLATRDQNYATTLQLINGFIFGFTTLGALSIFLLFVMTARMLKKIILPLETLNKATSAIAAGKRYKEVENGEFLEINNLAISFNEMATNVMEKEEALTAQNMALFEQKEELKDNQMQLEETLLEVKSIKSALDQSALLCITDERGIILSVNDKFTKVSKYTEKELVGNTTKILKSGFHSKAFYDVMWQSIKKGKIWSGKLKNVDKYDEPYWINATIVPFLNATGKAYQHILIGIDITENVTNELKLAQLLEETQKAKGKIEKYSQLNQALSLTIDRQKFLEHVFSYYDQIYSFDKGILFNIKSQQFMAKGFTDHKLDAFTEETHLEELLVRLKEVNYYTVKREANKEEWGLATEAPYIYDLYTRSLNDQQDVDLIFAISRTGNPFTAEEIEELTTMMQQLSVANSRIEMYEDVKRTTNINASIVKNVIEGLQLVNLDGDLILANEKLIELGELPELYKQIPLVKEKWMHVFAERFIREEALIDFYEQALENSNDHIRSFRCETKTVPSKHIEIYASPVFMDKEKTGVIFVYRDITREFEIDAMKSDLVSTVSHELRTPLSSVLGFTEMLMLKELKPERQKKYLETIHKEAKRLTNLINDFLDVQRIESGKQAYHMESVDLTKVIIEVVESFTDRTSHQIYIEDEALNQRVRADDERLKQLLFNLIGNAIKFSPDGGKIIIRLNNQDQNIKVSIEDEGIGVAEDQLKELFNKFKRIDNSSTKKIGGTGLGLAISKGIIEAHNGEIWIDSTEGVGTTVHFIMPIIVENLDKENMLAKSDNHQQSLTGPSLLLIEDDINLAFMMSEALKAEGYRVLHSMNTANILQLVKETKLLAIIVDLNLSESISGWDLIEQLKHDKTTREIPIVVSSAAERLQEKMEALNLHYYLTKPYPIDDLVTVIRKIDKQSTANT